MRRRILDTSILIKHWRRKCTGAISQYHPADAADWADELIGLRHSKWIVSPVLIEFLAVVTSREEMALALAFVNAFERLDQGDIRREDWEYAVERARRVPRNRKPRNLGDCLIVAVARRLNCDVDTLDESFGGR